jgi:hypothetical protein
MLQENKVSDDVLENVLVEKTLTDDGRKKEKHVKEEKVGEETYKVIEVFEEIPLSLKLKTKVIEKTKSFNLVYEKETITFNSETGEVVDSVIEKIDLPSLVPVYSSEEASKKEDLTNKPQVKNIIKSLEEKVKGRSCNTKKILDKVLLGVVVAQLAYLVYYFLIK